MRKIKFRFVKDNKLVYNSLRNLYKSEDWTEEQTYLWFVNEIMNGHGFSNIKLIQFTGLFDKNGKEVFEGDIIEMPLRKDRYFIYFKKGVFGVDSLKYKFIPLSEYKYYEVIGNIYENPELSKETEVKK